MNKGNNYKTTGELDKISRKLSYILRHNPKGYDIDENGWVPVWQICRNFNLEIEDLEYIVENNDKKRFVVNERWNLIRAAQGHSIPVELNLIRKAPPVVLYHGTFKGNMYNIRKEGLKKMARNHVHLSKDKETACNVGLRHAKRPEELIVLEVLASLMNFDGYSFYLSENNVWLTEHVPPQYIREKK